MVRPTASPAAACPSSAAVRLSEKESPSARTAAPARCSCSRTGRASRCGPNPNWLSNVQTKDVTVSVVGTVFLVNAEEDGSRVAVIEGEVQVHEGTSYTRLRPGEQVATSPQVDARPVKDAIAWSRQADVFSAILDSFARNMA